MESRLEESYRARSEGRKQIRWRQFPSTTGATGITALGYSEGQAGRPAQAKAITVIFHATQLPNLTWNLAASVQINCIPAMASEAMQDVQPGEKRPAVDIESLKCKKFKAEDLPLSAAQHTAIDKLLHSFKKKGGFDSIRKQLWADFNNGVCFRSSYQEIIKRLLSSRAANPQYRSRRLCSLTN